MENQDQTFTTETPEVTTGEVEVVDRVADFKKEEEVAPTADRSAYNCPDCAGEGLKDEHTLCPTCKGTGKV